MKKIKVLHQVLDPSGVGGVSAEFRALKRSRLSEKYDFDAMILKNFHSGVNFHDIKFYYKRIKEIKPDIVHNKRSCSGWIKCCNSCEVSR